MQTVLALIHDATSSIQAYRRSMEVGNSRDEDKLGLEGKGNEVGSRISTDTDIVSVVS